MRLYNGCPDKELKAILDDRQAAHDEAARHGIRLTWFPVEQRWAASRSIDHPDGYKSLGGFHRHIRDSLSEALEEMKGS